MKQAALAATNYIRQRTKIRPQIGIILGTGLGSLIKSCKISKTFAYGKLPHFPLSTVESHEGRLIVGSIKMKKIIAMQGRFHYYEGYSARQIALPVMVMKFLGVKYLIVSNASGGLNPNFVEGDIMIIADHINLIPDNPLRGKNDAKLGSRFPDLYNCYDVKTIKLAETIALKKKIPIKKGVYVAVPGPNLETKAEYRYLRTIGADAVGMSTVPEVLMARYLKMKVLGLSIITDTSVADALKPVSVPKIIGTAIQAEPKLTKIVAGVVEKL